MELRSSISTLYSSGEAIMSVRFENNEQADLLYRNIRRIVRKSSSETLNLNVDGSIKRRPMISTSSSDDIFSEIRSIAKDLGLRVSKEHRWGSSNISSFEDSAVIDSLGSISAASQNDDEFIYRHSLIDRALLLMMLLLRL